MNLNSHSGGPGPPSSSLVLGQCAAQKVNLADSSKRRENCDYALISTVSASSSISMSSNAQQQQQEQQSSNNKTQSDRMLTGPSCRALKTAVSALYLVDDFYKVKIGSGFFSEVYKVTHKTTGQVMVLKMNQLRSNRPNMLREVQLLNKLSHPNILKFMGVCVQEGQLHALTEFMNGGSLEQLLANKSINLSLATKIRLALGIARGMAYVHSCGFFHRDLTSKNVLIRKGPCGQFDAVVGDFGLAAKIPRCKTRLETVGSPYWMSPECLKGQWYDQTSDVFSFGIILCEIIARIEADPDILPRTNSFGLDYLQYVNLVPSNTPPGFLRLTFYCCIYDSRSRPTFVEIVSKLEMLLEKCDNALKTSEHAYKCTSADDAKNSKKTTVTVSPTKRLSVDNYCSNWLSSTYKTANESDGVGLNESNHLLGPSNNKVKNGHDTSQFRGFQAKNLHRRSLSENIIPFPPHTTPSDKARCHLINRKNSQFNASSEALDDAESVHMKAANATENGAECPIGIFSNTTLRKVAETMFLKDPQYKPHMSNQTYGKSNPFTTLTQLKGVKKIIGANPATYTAGVCDLFSSCFEIRVTKDSAVFPQRNGTGKAKTVLQAKSLPSSPKISQRKLSKIDKFVIQTSSKNNEVNDDDADDDLLFSNKSNNNNNNNNSKNSSNVAKKELLDVPNQCQTIQSTANDANERDSDALSRTGTLKKKNASSLFSHPLFKCKEEHGRNDDNYYFDNPKVLTRGGSSESGFFSCLTDEDFSTHRPRLSINGTCDYEHSLSSCMDDRSSTIPSALRSFDDFDLFDRNAKFDCSANDSLSIDMGLVNRLSLDSEINSLFQKNQLNNQLLYCKNRTSSIYTDSSEDISSLAGSDSLLWDDRMSSYSTTIPNTRSAQIAKIVEYFERKGQAFSSISSSDYYSTPSTNNYLTNYENPSGRCAINLRTAPTNNTNATITSNNSSSSSNNDTNSLAKASSLASSTIPPSHSITTTNISEYNANRKNLSSPCMVPVSVTPYQTTTATAATTSKEYEAFCFDLDKGMATPQRLNVCEGVVKSKLQLFDKLRNN